MSKLNIPLFYRILKKHLKLSTFASQPFAMINPQWLELPMSRTNFDSPNTGRAIEVLRKNKTEQNRTLLQNSGHTL